MRPSIRRAMRFASALLLASSIGVPGAESVCTNPIVLDPPLPFLTGPNSHYLAAGDFNEDGIPDFAVSNGDISAGSFNASLAVVLGTGNGAFASPVIYLVGRGSRGVVARDFNEDGITDLAVSNLWSDEISVLIGQGAGGVGNGTFAASVNYPAGPGPFELVADDFNGDGILDLATALNRAAAVLVFPGLGSGGIGNGSFGSAVSFPLIEFSTGLAEGDFNGDGRPDLVATQNFGGSVAVLLGTGQASIGPGSFGAPSYQPAGVEPYHVHVADVNEDGRQDLVAANTGFGGIKVLLGLGNGSFALNASLASGNNAGVTTADLNEDGILDIVTGTITGYNSGVARVFLGLGAGGVGNGTYGAGTAYASGGDFYQVISGDFDQDGLTDALVSQGYGNYTVLLPGTCAVDLRAPVLTDVRDVPNDNGGQVFLTWTASSLDAPGGAVSQYRVWRRIPPALMSAASPARLARGEIVALPAAAGGTQIDYWEALATLPAQRLPGYGYTAATTQDSMVQGNPHTAFFVTALTSNIDVFYSSNVDSGYSVDNIKPQKPNGLAGTQTVSGFALTWEPVDDADLAGYRLYRSSTEDFVPSEANLIAAPEEPGWVDSEGPGEWYYKLTAVDVHANESDVAELARVVSVGPDGPAPRLALLGARPNPSLDGRLTIHVALPDDAPARLDVLDLSGRRILSTSLASRGAGSHVVTVGESEPLKPGIYFARLVHGARSLESKIVVAR